MDPKALSHLDPKARDAYDRVMGTAAEIHGDTPSEPNTADTSSIDSLSQSTAPEPFDTSVGGLTSSTTETPSVFGTADSTPAEPSPSIFTNNAAEPDPTQTAIPQPQQDTNSFLPNTAAPAATTDTLDPNLASAQGFPPIPQPESTSAVPSDDTANVEPVTPYSPGTSENSSSATMEQPFNTQPLPSPAEVNQPAHHETSALLRVLYIIGAVIFFAIYTIFWVKVFNLPFLF